MQPKSFYDGTSLVKRDLAYDQYAEIANQTRIAKLNLAVNTANAALNAQNVQLNQQQLAISQQMSQSLRSIAGIMDDVRKSQKETLAIQQELLMRDQLQSFIEEFIYSTEKLVNECKRPDCEMPVSSRYFLLLGVIKTVEQEGLSTPLIRGRDNKSAFEGAISSVQRLIDYLASEQEVKEAVAWANEEQRKRDEEVKQARLEKQRKQEEARREKQRKLEEERQRQQDAADELSQLTHRRDNLLTQKSKVDWSASKLVNWVQEKHQRFLGKQSKPVRITAYVLLHPFFMLLPVWYYIEQLDECNRKDKDLNERIAALNKEIAIKSTPNQSS